MTEGFPNLSDYSLWLADTSHRIRHGISRVMTYKSCTTASISYDIDNHVLVGQVATKIASRGGGFAQEGFLPGLQLILNSREKLRSFMLWIYGKAFTGKLDLRLFQRNMFLRNQKTAATIY